MKWFSRAIVKGRYLILLFSILLLVPAGYSYLHTHVNYDILTYLPSEIDTMQGQEILKDEFGTGSFSMVVTEGLADRQVEALVDNMKTVDHVKQAIWYGSVADLSFPVSMLPDDVGRALENEDARLIIVMFDTSMSADETMQAVEEIRHLTDQGVFVAGMSAIVTDTRALADQEEPIYVLLAVLLCFLVLSVTMDSFMIPLFFLLSIGMAVIYNLGTNFFLGEVSYITKAIAAVLQLGVTMDYSIFLWHSFTEQMDLNGGDDKEAMALAIEKTFSSVIGSSVTTVAGFIALCFMSFTLGLDLGIVMAKGVLIGVLACVTILPSMIMIFRKATVKTMHKPLLPQFRITGFVMKHYKAIAVLFCLMWIPALIGYNNMSVYYKLDSSLPRSLPSIQAQEELDDNFEMGAMHIVMASSDLSAKNGSMMCDEMEDVQGVKAVLGQDSVMGPALVREMVPDELLEDMKTQDHQLILVISEYAVGTDEMNTQCDALESIIKKYDAGGMLIGEGPCTRDLIHITNHDFARVSTVSIAIIFAIILLVFGSASLPVILIFVIEFAVYLNLGIPYYTGTTLPFIASIVIGTVQLGSTVDYAILMTNRYRTERIAGMDKYDAVRIAHEKSIQSIFVSALSFFAATCGVGLYSNIDMISSLCTLMARGALISMITVVTVLPAMLLIFDRVILVTTWKGKNRSEKRNWKVRTNG